MKKILFRLLGIVIVLGAAWGAYRFFQQLPARVEQIAIAKVRRGDVVIRAFSRGELRAVRSVTLTAPNLFTTVQVTRLAPVGSLAKEKDLIVEFDDSERRAQLEETLMEVEQIDETIKKSRADLSIRDNQDSVDLLRNRYSVRRAELEVQRNEIISAIDAKKNLLTLEEQRRRLKQLESDIKSRKEQAEAEIAVLQEQRNKGMIDVEREKQRIAQAKVLSPMTGLVAIRQNRTSFFNFGQAVPDIREGDTLQPGMQVADILDLSELEVVAKVGELDRANLHEGQDVNLALDAVPEKRFHGKIKSMSGTASANVFSGDPAKKFDVVFSIDMRELLTQLGVKPEKVNQILAIAERNRSKAPANAMPSVVQMASMQMGGPPQGGPPGMPMVSMPGMQGGPGGTEAEGEGAGGRGGKRGGGGGRKRDEAKGGDAKGGDAKGGAAKGGDAKGTAAKGGDAKGAAAKGSDAKGGKKGGGTPSYLEYAAKAAAASGFTEKDRDNAKLPLPPEEDSSLEVLLRPGLLADVEIIIEKIPNALHVPAQAVFEREGQRVVYVKKGNKFEPKVIKLAKRSESTMVLESGVNDGDIIALADPFARKGDKKGDKKGGGAGGGAMSGMPAGGKN